MAETQLALKTTRRLLHQLGLPASLISRVHFSGTDPLRSTLHLGEFAQALIATTALAASQLHDLRSGTRSNATNGPIPRLRVRCDDAVAEFRSEHVATLDGEKPFEWDELAAAYEARGSPAAWIRPHTNWEHHKRGFLDLLGLPATATKQDVAAAVRLRDADELAEQAMQRGLVCTALRSYAEWDAHPQGRAALARAPHGPVRIDRLGEPQPPAPLPPLLGDDARKPLRGIRVLDLTRVIAGPVAGRVLELVVGLEPLTPFAFSISTGYGADVLWSEGLISFLTRDEALSPALPLTVTSPSLPTLPGLDFDTSRGKRSVHLDLRHSPSDRRRFESLIKEADVLLQSYAPGALARLGFGVERVRELNPRIVYASLNGWGAADLPGKQDAGEEEKWGGPWRERKAFDSLVQFASGISHAEGVGASEQADEFSPRQLPCQALDHGSGYLVASGILSALTRRHTEGGSYLVTTSLLDTATLLRSLGSKPFAPNSSLSTPPLETPNDLRARGRLGVCAGRGGKQVEYVKHAAVFERGEVQVGWEKAPERMGADEAEWLPF